MGEAAEAYQRALGLATNDIERKFLRRRVAEMKQGSEKQGKEGKI
jgi:predicted RNA polymerase sigma factor